MNEIIYKPIGVIHSPFKGVFATRAPLRPNQIGLSIVRLTGVSENILDIEDVDIVDGTPLLDIKPLQKDCLMACRLFLRERGWTHD